MTSNLEQQHFSRKHSFWFYDINLMEIASYVCDMPKSSEDTGQTFFQDNSAHPHTTHMLDIL
jgi:hypothetical protein